MIERFYKPNSNFVHIVLSEDIDDVQIYQHVQDYQQEVEHLSGLLALADARKLNDVSKLTMMGCVGAAKQARGQASLRNGKLAFVVPNQLVYETARMYTTIVADFQSECELFYNLNDAIAWLGTEEPVDEIKSFVSEQMKESFTTHTFHFSNDEIIKAPIDTVFPMMCPQGRGDWDDNWDFSSIGGEETLYSDYIFTTSNEGVVETIWIVKEYNPDVHHIEYYKVEPYNKITVISIHCYELDDNETMIRHTNKFTALGKVGLDFINELDEESYQDFIDERITMFKEALGL